MTPRRYTAPHAAQALARIRAELGDDALVLGSRSLPGGVEFLASTYADLLVAAPPPAEPRGLTQELRELRRLVGRQLSGLAFSQWKRRDPARVLLVGSLLDAGFSPQLARTLAAHCPRGLDGEAALRWVRQILLKNLPLVADDPIRPGVRLALVGPTGAGKTTTLAKLAARAAERWGATNVFLVSVDDYRVGARAQMAEYAQLLGCEFQPWNSGSDWAAQFAALPASGLVLVDVPGHAQGDARVRQEGERLAALGVARWLVLPATLQGTVADAVVHAFGGVELAACVLTKLDEALLAAPALDTLLRWKLPLARLSLGQRVPEDLYPARLHWLVDRALRQRAGESHRLREEDMFLLQEDISRRHHG